MASEVAASGRQRAASEAQAPFPSDVRIPKTLARPRFTTAYYQALLDPR